MIELTVAGVGDQMLTSLLTAVPAAIVTVAVSWLAVLRTKVDRRIEAEFEREGKRFEDRLQRKRELVMRMLEKEMLDPLEALMQSAYGARNAARELAALPPDAADRAAPVQRLDTDGVAFQKAIMANRVKLNALSAFDEAHALKNALLDVLQSEHAGEHDRVRERAAFVEKAFKRFDAALTDVLGPDEADAARGG